MSNILKTPNGPSSSKIPIDKNCGAIIFVIYECESLREGRRSSEQTAAAVPPIIMSIAEQKASRKRRQRWKNTNVNTISKKPNQTYIEL